MIKPLLTAAIIFILVMTYIQDYALPLVERETIEIETVLEYTRAQQEYRAYINEVVNAH